LRRKPSFFFSFLLPGEGVACVKEFIDEEVEEDEEEEEGGGLTVAVAVTLTEGTGEWEEFPV
jgi:hypothetical protein